MKLALTARIRKLFDRYAVRITIGVVFSLLVHALFLSLQLGIQGLGLPGLGMPWAERRAITPALSIRLINAAGPTSAQLQASSPPIPNDTPPKPREATTASDQSLTELPSAHVKQAPARIAPVAPRSAKALKSSPAIAAVTKKNGSSPPDDQSAPAPARSEPELITLSGDHPDTFSVPAPDRDSWWRPAPKTDSIPLPIQPLEETAPPTIGVQSPKQTIERSQEPAPALQKPSELESFERPDEVTAKEPEPSKKQDVAAELAVHKEGEEIAAQEAARKSAEQEAAQRAQDEQTRKQEEAHKEEEAARELAAKKLFEEQLAQREKQAAEKKLADEKRKEEAEAERQAKEIAVRTEEAARQQAQAAALALQKQREAAQQEEIKKQQEEAKAKQQALEVAARQQAEEIARQKTLEIQKQKQEEQIAALKKAQELAALHKAEAEAEATAAAAAAIQRENARTAAIAAAAAASAPGNSADGNSGTSAGKSGNQLRGAGAGDLASKALEQISKIDLTRIAPALPNDANHPEEDTRRGSFWGRKYEADVVVDAYIRDWRNKIERGGSMNYSQSSKDLARENPVVTVAIRSDGSVEDIVFNRSSGRMELDEAVRRIVRFNAPYGKFSANLARKFSVIEIRRIWNFDDTLKLLEEVH